MSGNVELRVGVAHPFPMILCSALPAGLEGTETSLGIFTGNGFLVIIESSLNSWPWALGLFKLLPWAQLTGPEQTTSPSWAHQILVRESVIRMHQQLLLPLRD